MDLSVASDFGRLTRELPAIQEALKELSLDGWLLYDLHARNAVAGRMLGLGDLTRRYFVWIPAVGEPCAVVHGIEQAPWRQWPWERRVYVGWRALEESLSDVLPMGAVAAMEVSAGDAVPALDLVPAGVQEMVEAAGGRVVSSGDLVTRFHSRWSAEGLASHRRAAAVLARVAGSAFDHLAAAAAGGLALTDAELREWVLERLREGGLGVGADAIVAGGARAADPHYQPAAPGVPLAAGEVVLLDLWGKESEAAVYADQTWMAFLGTAVPAEVEEAWRSVRSARDLAVHYIRAEWRAGRTPQGYEVDDAVRGLLTRGGYGPAFIHRTGHSIDHELHGMGPNIDHLETRETRRLIQGVGFSVEPGVYFDGRFGLRSEINVYLGAGGPEVTTPGYQTNIRLLDGGS